MGFREFPKGNGINSEAALCRKSFGNPKGLFSEIRFIFVYSLNALILFPFFIFQWGKFAAG